MENMNNERFPCQRQNSLKIANKNSLRYMEQQIWAYRMKYFLVKDSEGLSDLLFHVLVLDLP